MKQKGLNLNKVIFYLLILFLLFLIIHYIKIALTINENLEVDYQVAGKRSRMTTSYLDEMKKIYETHRAKNFSDANSRGAFGYYRSWGHSGLGQNANLGEKQVAAISNSKGREQDSLDNTNNDYNSKKSIEDGLHDTIIKKNKELNNIPKPTRISLKYHR